MRKWLLLIVIAMVSAIMLAACGGGNNEGNSNEGNENNNAESNNAESNDDANSEEADSGETFVIGASQFVEHPSLDAAFDGFKQAIEDAGLNVEYDFQNAQADQNNVKTISDNLVADNVDLIFANATPSALGAQNATTDIPILFTSVTDAVETGLVESMDNAGGNITGVVDLHPGSIEKTMEFIDTYFPDSNIGIVYNAGEANSVIQIDAVNEAVKGTSLEVSERTVSTSAEVQQAAMTLAGDVDVFFIFTDNTVVSAFDSVVGVADEQQIPLFVGEPDSLEGGGFATYGIDYFTIGYRTGEMAVEILRDGKSPADIKPEYPSDMQLMINKTAAEKQNVEWNDEWDDIAEFIE